MCLIQHFQAGLQQVLSKSVHQGYTHFAVSLLFWVQFSLLRWLLTQVNTLSPPDEFPRLESIETKVGFPGPRRSPKVPFPFCDRCTNGQSAKLPSGRKLVLRASPLGQLTEEKNRTPRNTGLQIKTMRKNDQIPSQTFALFHCCLK